MRGLETDPVSANGGGGEEISHYSFRERWHDYRRRKNVVPFCYPRDCTPGCIAVVCGFRGGFRAVTGYDAVILGVSQDGEAVHKKFSLALHLPYHLHAEKDGSIWKLYDVNSSTACIRFNPRVTFIIGTRG